MVPLISFDLTISCLTSLLLVPGFVRLIFILRPLSTVDECSTAILPGLPGLPCAAFTLLTTALLCLLLVPVTIDEEPFAFPVLPLLPALPALPLPLPGLFDRPDEFNPQEDEAEDRPDDDNVDEDEHEEEETEEEEEDDDEEDDDEEDDWLQPFGLVVATAKLAEFKPFAVFCS